MTLGRNSDRETIKKHIIKTIAQQIAWYTGVTYRVG
jgi:hypothetical protein